MSLYRGGKEPASMLLTAEILSKRFPRFNPLMIRNILEEAGVEGYHNGGGTWQGYEWRLKAEKKKLKGRGRASTIQKWYDEKEAIPILRKAVQAKLKKPRKWVTA